MRILRLVFLLAIFVVGLAFAVINSNPVRVEYYFGGGELPLALALILAFALGALLGMIVHAGKVFRLKREISSLRRSTADRERELTNLRTLPLRDDR